MTEGTEAAVEGKNTPEQIKFITEARALQDKNAKLTIRLTLASAFHTMWVKAFDALLHHGVNVRSIPEYNDHARLDRALEVGVEHDGGSRVMDYIKRVENGLRAAIARKGFKQV